MRIPLACCFLSCVANVTYLHFFFSTFPVSTSIWGAFAFILSFSCGYYAVSSVSVSAATRLAYSHDIYICVLIRTYADLTFLFLSEVYDLFQLLLCIIFGFYLFSPEVISAPELLEPVL